MDRVIVYIINAKLIKNNVELVSSFVDETRRTKASKLGQEKDTLLSFGAAYLMKKYLPKGEIKETVNGKPYLDGGPYFNVSHSGGYALLAVHPTREVGADIQIIDVSKINAIKYVLNDKEKETSDIKTLHLMWSNKESLIKCLSSGLQDIKIVSALPLEGVRKVDGNNYFSRSQIYENYSLSVTLQGNYPFDIEIIKLSSLEV